MKKPLHITLAQINPVVGDIAGNMAAMLDTWRKTPPQTDLVLFPELALCGYPPEDLVLKPAFLNLVDTAVTEITAATKGHKKALVLPAPCRKDGKIFNAAHLIDDGKITATVLKHNLPNYGVFDEKRIFSAGPLPAPVSFRDHNLGLMICEDIWWPEPAAHLKENGAEILLVLNASPYETDKHQERLEIARKRVSGTGLPLVYLNMTGGQDDLVFDGGSFVMNEGGKIIMQAHAFHEETHDLIFEKTDSGHWLCLTDTIAALPEPDEEMYQAAVTGLRDYVRKNAFPGVLLGLSGGIDSALTAVMAVDALGPQAVHAVMMPSRFTSPQSLEDAQTIAHNLGIRLDNIPIDDPVGSFESILKPFFTPQTPSVTHENIQPRCRGIILMALSNATGKLLLSTGNKSEIAAGYATLYGDMCGGYNPLRDIYKTQVYALSRWRNTQSGVIPPRVLTRAPTAELRENQTDQDTLPPYDILDGILHCLIETDGGVEDAVKAGFDRATAIRVMKMLDSTEYKRRQAAPGPKISPRAFGRERRYPMTSRFSKIVEK